MAEETFYEYERLCDEIWMHNRAYFQEGKPKISDDDFDKLVRRLEDIEKAHPEWISGTSPTQRIGEKPLEGFQEIVHKFPMLSLEKVFSKEELIDFQTRIQKLLEKKDVLYCAELKMDGLAISVRYEEGRFVSAVTRGDGKVGSDVTQNLKTIRSLPLRLFGKSVPKVLEIRGEVYLPIKAFEMMNKEREEKGEPLWANPRNAAAGSLKLLDPKEVAKRTDLSCVFYGMSVDSSHNEKSQYNLHQYLHELGLPTLKSVLEGYLKQHRELREVHIEGVRQCKTIDDILEFANHVMNERPFLPFGIDGIVIKLDNLEYYEQLGSTAKHPRGAVAYKFSADQVRTKILNIVVQVGRTGVLTPVAELDPVFLAGSTVSRATLHNEDEIQRKDIRIGDIALIEKGGDVIPKVVSVDASKRQQVSEPWHMPTTCPSCGAHVVKDPHEVALRCPNAKECFDQIWKRLVHFAGKGGLDIENLGEKVLLQLIQKKIVKKPSDIFALTANELAKLEGFKEKSIHNLLTSIEKAKHTSLARLLMALGIRYVGSQAADAIAKLCNESVEKLYVLSENDFLECQGIGEKVANSCFEYFRDIENREEIERLVHLGLVIQKPKNIVRDDTPFFKKNFVLTGSLKNFTRQQAGTTIKDFGGYVSDTVNKKTDFLVVGDEPGSKFEKAKKLGVKILDEAQFLHMVNTNLG